MAILYNADAPLPPSNRPALESFLRAAAALGMRAEIIDRGAIERLAEFDALFIRDTTSLDHYTYRFAQRAAALGLVVIDDPDSILQCNNKVYLNELLTRQHIPVPRTLQHGVERAAKIGPEHQGHASGERHDTLGGERHHKQHDRHAGVGGPGEGRPIPIPP